MPVAEPGYDTQPARLERIARHHDADEDGIEHRLSDHWTRQGTYRAKRLRDESIRTAFLSHALT